MKFKIVLINFPFDDFTQIKLRPALCLTDFISNHKQVILAPITSKNTQAANSVRYNHTKNNRRFARIIS
jgi:hypothetical protein